MNGNLARTSEALTGSGADFDADVALTPVKGTGKHRATVVWHQIEQQLIRASDWLNPILVKETRQALKSFQFTTTFVLVLAACWVITIGGLAYIGPSVFFSASGGSLLIFYYAVLAFPLIVVVPYSAFRSLASEREDNTYDLLSITALRPRQIISGKLCSSIVQMAVYFSAITPCLAFTYLLRGVDLPIIVVLMVYTFFGSLGLSMLGILLATLSEQRFAQVFVSVAFVALLLMLLFWTVPIAYAFINYSRFGDDDFWIVSAAFATAYVTTFALMYYAAAGMIAFSTENRSTPLRYCMLAQHGVWIGWMAYAWIDENYELGFIMAMAACAGLYWCAMGAMLTAERPGMSHRVQRGLPKTFLGRVFLSWLNPGPATGYMLAVANGSAIVAIGFLGIAASAFLNPGGGSPWPTADGLFYVLIVGWGYCVAYLGAGMIVISLLRRVAHVNLFAGVLIHVILVLAGSGIPTTIQLMSVDMRMMDYTYLQLPNPFWSLAYIVDKGTLTEGPVLAVIVPAVGICVLLLNMRAVVRELQAVRVAAPSRVLQDEAELHPLPEALPQNPWDEPAKV